MSDTALIWPEPIWAIEVEDGSDWPRINPADIRDYTKNPFIEPESRYHESGLAKLRAYGIIGGEAG